MALDNGRRSPRKLLRAVVARARWRLRKVRFDIEFIPDSSEGRIRAASYLTILSREMPPEELARLVGMQPDKKWTRGELRNVGPIPLAAKRFNGVNFTSGLGDFASPSQHFAALIERLRPFAARIAAVADLPSTHGVTVWIVEHTERDDVDAVAELEDIEVVAAMHAKLVFSSYLGW
jgi:Domain of unknown function (DUF4279)